MNEKIILVLLNLGVMDVDNEIIQDIVDSGYNLPLIAYQVSLHAESLGYDLSYTILCKELENV